MSAAVLSTAHDKSVSLRRPIVNRRTRRRVDQLDAQILAVLREDHPQSVRHVFYRMTDPRLPEPVEKSDYGYRAVQHRITELRRARRLPYWWITDATRRGYHVSTYATGAEFVEAMSGYFRAPLWANADVHLEVWCESRSIAGVIERDCKDLAVSLYPAGGFTSISLAYGAASSINRMVEDDPRPFKVIYIGDYDPAGVLIDQAIERELREHLSASVDLEFLRLAITEAQIEKYGLPGKPRKVGDRRALHIKETVEAEAMPAAIMRKLLRDRIEAYLPEGALEATRVAEQSERDGLKAWAEIMRMSPSAEDTP